MRDFKGMKRQRGRNRGGGGGGSGGGGGKQPQNANRSFDSNGPEGIKVRGNAQTVFEKYQQLARDSNAAGDRVLGENYLQHAEHYFRLLRAMQPMRPASEILGRDHFSSGFDIDFEDEGAQAQSEAADEAAAEAAARGETPAAPEPEVQPRWQNERPRDERPRDDRARDDRARDDRARDERPRTDRYEARDDRNRPRDERPREERPRDERSRDERPRDDRPRAEGGRDRWRDDRPREDRVQAERPRAERDDRPRYDRQDRAERPDRHERDPMPVIEPQAQPFTSEERGPVLRDAEGGESHAPAFLQARPEPAGEGGEVKKPRRRRVTARSADGAPPASETEDA